MGRTIGQPVTGVRDAAPRGFASYDAAVPETAMLNKAMPDRVMPGTVLRDASSYEVVRPGTGPDPDLDPDLDPELDLEPDDGPDHDPDSGRRAKRGRQDPENLRDFDEFYLGTIRRVTAQVVAMLGDPLGVEDAVQEAYARAWQRWGEVSRMADPAGWVRVVAYRIKVSTWRSSTRRLAAHRRHGPAPDVPEHGPETVMLVNALRKLPEAQRRALVLYHLAGMSIDEVAAEVGAPAGTVKARLSRGRAAMAELLADQSESERPGSGPGSRPGPGSGPGSGVAARKRAGASRSGSSAGAPGPVSKAAMTALAAAMPRFLRRLASLRPKPAFG